MEIPFKKKDGEASILETVAALPAGGSPGQEPINNEMGFRTKVILAAVLVAVALLSFFVIGNIAENPETHTATIEALDKSKENVMLLTVGALGVSTVASVLPGDAGKPVSETLTQIISGLAVVLAVILLEKYLLTVFGFAVFKILVPIGCLILAATLFMRKSFGPKRTLAQLASKLMVFGLVLFLAIPLSVGASQLIQQQYEAQFQETIDASDMISSAVAEDVDATAEETSATAEGEQEKNKSLLENLGSALASIPDAAAQIPENIKNLPESVGKAATESVSGVADGLSNFVKKYVEGFAVMIVTSCLIPIIVLVLFLWLANVLLGINVSIPRIAPPALAKRKEEGAQE